MGNRRNRKRDAERLPNNLRLRCYVCYTTRYRGGEGGELGGVAGAEIEYSVPTPCCQRYIHEYCLVRWFERSQTCPWCRARLIPVNRDDPIPARLTGNATVIHLQEYRFNQFLPAPAPVPAPVPAVEGGHMQPPIGWGEYMRSNHPHVPRSGGRPG